MTPTFTVPTAKYLTMVTKGLSQTPGRYCFIIQDYLFTYQSWKNKEETRKQRKKKKNKENNKTKTKQE